LINFNYLDINGFNILSNDIYASIDGLMDLEQQVIMNDLYTSGSSYNRSKIGERHLVLNVLIKNNQYYNRNKLRSILFSPSLKILTIGIDGYPKLYVLFDLANWVSSPTVGVDAFTCQLICPDPRLYEAIAHTVSLGSQIGTSPLTYPISYPITYGIPTGATGIITNLGNNIAYPIATIVGTCSNFTLTNLTTLESITVNVALGASDILIIDSSPNNRGIYLNGVKRMDLKSGTWLSCPPGDNNFQFTRTSLESKQHCSLSLQGVWI